MTFKIGESDMARISRKLKEKLINSFPNIDFSKEEGSLLREFATFSSEKKILARELKALKAKMNQYVKRMSMKNPSPDFLFEAYAHSMKLREVARDYRHTQRCLNLFWVNLGKENKKQARKRKK